MKKFIIIIPCFVLILLVLCKPVSAAEITPAPGSYDYGSTSEYSPAVIVQAGTPTAESDLADTGDPQKIMVVAALALIVSGAVGFAYILIQKKKAT